MHYLHPLASHASLYEVALSVKPLLEILEITNDAWNTVSPNVFQSAWVVCGYRTAKDFEGAEFEGPPVQSVEEAEHILDPSGVLKGTRITGTPQFCSTMQWQIKD